MKLLRDIPSVQGKKVLVRADFDVPVESGQVEDDTRIKAVLPTLNFLLSKEAVILILAHLGRPEGKEEKFSLKPVAKVLKGLLGKKINFLEEPAIQNFETINLLENLRFWPGEEGNDINFTKKLSSLGDFYVNDAFAVCHRAHASVVGIPKLLRSFAGANLEQEVNELSRVLEKPERPLVAIIGGAKIETKLPAIVNLSRVADKVLVGGKLMFEVTKENLPANVIVANDDLDGKDIGTTSIDNFSKIIGQAAVVVWNGPLGVFEEEKYASGTKAIAQALVGSRAYAIIGGGDTIAALNKFGLLAKISYVSTGGGAMLDFLAGEKLPGLEALEAAL